MIRIPRLQGDKCSLWDTPSMVIDKSSSSADVKNQLTTTRRRVNIPIAANFNNKLHKPIIIVCFDPLSENRSGSKRRWHAVTTILPYYCHIVSVGRVTISTVNFVSLRVKVSNLQLRWKWRSKYDLSYLELRSLPSTLDREIKFWEISRIPQITTKRWKCLLAFCDAVALTMSCLGI